MLQPASPTEDIPTKSGIGSEIYEAFQSYAETAHLYRVTVGRKSATVGGTELLELTRFDIETQRVPDFTRENATVRTCIDLRQSLNLLTTDRQRHRQFDSNRDRSVGVPVIER